MVDILCTYGQYLQKKGISISLSLAWARLCHFPEPSLGKTAIFLQFRGFCVLDMAFLHSGFLSLHTFMKDLFGFTVWGFSPSRQEIIVRELLTLYLQAGRGEWWRNGYFWLPTWLHLLVTKPKCLGAHVREFSWLTYWSGISFLSSDLLSWEDPP